MDSTRSATLKPRHRVHRIDESHNNNNHHRQQQNGHQRQHQEQRNHSLRSSLTTTNQSSTSSSPCTCRRLLIVVAITVVLMVIIFFQLSMVWMYVHSYYEAKSAYQEAVGEQHQITTSDAAPLKLHKKRVKPLIHSKPKGERLTETKNIRSINKGWNVEDNQKMDDVPLDPLGAKYQIHTGKKFTKLDFLTGETYHHSSSKRVMNQQPPQQGGEEEQSHLQSQSQRSQLRVQYLGILVDAGRHYFDIPWLYRLVDLLPNIGFNLIHFRISDDQAFAIQLDCCTNQIHAHYSSSSTSGSSPSTLHGADDGTTYKYNYYYTSQQISDWVLYAKTKHNITIIPELNVPGHAGGFGKEWILNCPNFICNKGYGIPLNISHPELPTLLSAILKEIIAIFHNPPFLHLGGDEIDMSTDCIREAGSVSKASATTATQQEQLATRDDGSRNSNNDDTGRQSDNDDRNNPLQYFDHFEKVILPNVLHSIGYPREQVIRWEIGHAKNKNPQNQQEHLSLNTIGDATNDFVEKDKVVTNAAGADVMVTSNGRDNDQDEEDFRAGGLIHYWEGPSNRPIRISMSNTSTASNNNRSSTALSQAHRPYFISRGLYFDTNKFDWAWDIYQHTLRLLNGKPSNHGQRHNGDRGQLQPTGIIVGTFELNSTFWHHRAVIPRLVAVALAASSNVPMIHGEYDDNLAARQYYRNHYRPACLNLGLDQQTCSQNGRIPKDTSYDDRWKTTWAEWKTNVCHQLQ